MQVVAITLLILWVLSLWLLLLQRRRPAGLVALPPFVLMVGTVLFFLLSLSSLLFLRLAFSG
ncbi:MAG: hypothetical protein AB1671_05775 [Thermodesulfobacteriota bacterium]